MCHPAWQRELTTAQHLRDLARLRRVRDRIDREHAQPLDVEALAREAAMPAEDLTVAFRAAYGQTPSACAAAGRERAAALLGRPPQLHF